jgi:hypothetical protein
MLEIMTREEARDYFKARLTYKDVHIEELEHLQKMFRMGVSSFFSGNNDVDFEYRPYIERIRKNDKRFNKGGLVGARLHISSCYYTRKELVTFNPSGFISFFGWADDFHADALLPVFIEWVDSLCKYK